MMMMMMIKNMMMMMIIMIILTWTEHHRLGRKRHCGKLKWNCLRGKAQGWHWQEEVKRALRCSLRRTPHRLQSEPGGATTKPKHGCRAIWAGSCCCRRTQVSGKVPHQVNKHRGPGGRGRDPMEFWALPTRPTESHTQGGFQWWWWSSFWHWWG